MLYVEHELPVQHIFYSTTRTHEQKVAIQTHILSVSIFYWLRHAAWTVVVLQTSHCSCRSIRTAVGRRGWWHGGGRSKVEEGRRARCGVVRKTSYILLALHLPAAFCVALLGTPRLVAREGLFSFSRRFSIRHLTWRLFLR